MKMLEPICANRKTKWLFTDKISYADFWFGALWTNNFNNPHCQNGPEEWPKLQAANPAFSAYGKQFE